MYNGRYRFFREKMGLLVACFPTRRRILKDVITDPETTLQIILRDKRYEVWLLADY
jgi:hypothetical protein